MLGDNKQMVTLAEKRQELEESLLKEIKPIAVLNGQKYYSVEQHQQFLDLVDPETKVYHRQVDEDGKTVFNGVDRLVINPSMQFAVLVEEKEDEVLFVIDYMAVYAKKNGGGVFEMRQVPGFSAPKDSKGKAVLKNAVKTYFDRETFLNEFSIDLYEVNPEKAIDTFAALTQLGESAVAKSVSFL